MGFRINTNVSSLHAQKSVKIVSREAKDSFAKLASGIITRMRELAIGAASDTMTASERSMFNMEYQQLKQELERISQGTEFNGKKLLNGTGSGLISK